MQVDSKDLLVKTLGPCRVASPLGSLLRDRRPTFHNVAENDRVVFDDTISALASRTCAPAELPSFEPAGARSKIFFDPSKTRVGIVTCGGLCPGLNDVIRAIVLELVDWYGVDKIYGFRNGYQGFIASYGRSVVDLTGQVVSSINEQGGTILGTSRGQQDPAEIVDCLERMSINILFVIGGDGTIRGALGISKEIAERGAKIAVVGIPKTIDNDIMFIDQSFGFQTAFSEATKSIRAAHVEATASPNGVGLVRLMGRHSGFIACYASLAMSDANFVLIPEVPFQLDGENGLLNVLRKRLLRRHHAVMVVAEGAGQNVLSPEHGGQGTDASGNVKLQDIGLYLKKRITDYFAGIGMELNLKYIDPSYAIRSVPANPYDSVYCIRLGHNAVHAAMSGRTEMVVGRWNSRFVHVPMPLAIRERYTVDPDGDLWMSVLESTGQPRSFQ
ncbi:ATP-dependent 6-phosphofructokinase [Fimbriiglobus ruber]|uniref:ATP-dependent 6-phosphofructokinase n=1 Tax=Fimbriiglobus ruber TaxID=1908690 RepID=A0A225DEJ7_9BACT|nr:ATP-dependent 6-phosphofructokinase [Fimbriiglobus ruber]OWK34815.1 6-phosphofructokinase [Fimbriiglobus ruber]